MATSFPGSLDTLTNPLSTDTLNSPSHSGQHADANDAIEALQAKVGVDGSAVTTSIDYKLNNTVATLTGTQTLTNKTLTSPVLDSANLAAVEEKWQIVAAAPNSFQTLFASQGSVQYHTVNASSNFTVWIEFSGGSSLNNNLNVGDSITVGLIVTNGATARYVANVGVDTLWGAGSPTVYWQGGTAPTSGNANSRDLYVFTVLKTAASTYTVFASQTKFA